MTRRRGLWLVFVFLGLAGATFWGAVGGPGVPGANFFEFSALGTPATPAATALRVFTLNTANISQRLLQVDGQGMVTTYTGVILRASGPNISNSAAETTLGTMTVKGKVLNEFGRTLDIRVRGLLLNNTGGNQGVTYKVKLGALTLLTLTTGNIAPLASFHGVEVRAQVSTLSPGAAGTHYALGHLTLVNAGVGGTSLGVQLSDASASNNSIGTLDFTADLTLTVTAQLSAANANLQCNSNITLVEIR